MKIPLASSGLREKDIQAAIAVLTSGNLTMGNCVSKFESEMANYLQVNDFVMFNSGSSANLAIIESLLRPAVGEPRLMPGDGVLVPAIAWPTTIWPLIQLGLNPIFVDIDPNTLSIDLESASQKIKISEIPVKGIFVIHPLGRAIDSVELENFARKYDLILLNDVCESLGSWRNGVHAGINGLASSFSFYFSHHLTTMEGGGVAVNDRALGDDLRSIRSHGWSRGRSDAVNWEGQVSKTDSKFLFVTSGFNLRPMEIQGAIGSSQLKDLDSFVKKRQEIARYVHSKIQGGSLHLIGSELFANKQYESQNSWMLLPIRVMKDNYKSSKREILEELTQLGIETRPVLTGNFLDQPAINRVVKLHLNPREFTNADLISDSTFLISAHHDLSEDQIEFLGESLSDLGNK